MTLAACGGRTLGPPVPGDASWARAPAISRVLLVALMMSWACLGRAEGAPGRVGGVVATVHPLATQAGIEALEGGGNAIDAAVAAALTLGVVDAHDSGIGGGCFMLIRSADGRLVCIDGREMAPRAASRDMYIREGRPDASLSKTGPLASAVPGALAAYQYALDQFGRRKLADALRAGIRHAEEGFPIDAVFARKLKVGAGDIARFPASRAIFLKPDGSPYQEGETLVQKDLAQSYRALAEVGADWFYREPFPRECEASMGADGGILAAEDFRKYRIRLRDPLITTYQEWTVVGVPPPSSGGVHVAQMLNILEHFDFRCAPAESPDAAHMIIEAMKLAFADRAHWLGDPDFADVPRGLVDKGYGAALFSRIDPFKATRVSGHGEPPDWQSRHFEKHTTHFAAADELGNWVACTATINTPFGSKVVIPGTGILMNNEMDDFSIAPGQPNSFQLVGADANAIAPGKRPLSSMSPTLVMKGGRVVLAIGASGGPTIISQTLLGLVRCLDYAMSPVEALRLPRFHHQWSPDRVRIEKGYSDDFRENLRRRGHVLDAVENFGACQIIGIDATGEFSGASDPRVPGLAAVVP
ncbi:MAG TPA: gamma-glutamyltransferase [Verrucomicrobiae bacterium]|nr:gamma-glutamyltransferase [Verrucomicrobiae bacterium]